MKLVYKLSDKGRKALFIETGTMPSDTQACEVDPALLSREQRALLVPMLIGDMVTLVYSDVRPSYDFSGWRKPLTLDSIATSWESLLATYAQVAAEGAARLTAQQDAEVARRLELFQAWNSSRQPDMIPASLTHHARGGELEAAYAAAKERAFHAQREERAQKDAEQAEREAAKQAKLDERRAWALQHGSVRLQKCISAGYDCQRLYVTERAARDHPQYALDFDDNAAWRDRSGPSEAALDEAARVGGTVVWLTHGPAADHDDDDDETPEPCEAVVIRRYLGSYDLIRVL